MTEAIDITGLNFQQLDDLRHRVELRVTEMREIGAPALREQWAEQAAGIGSGSGSGMTIEEIIEGGKGGRGRSRTWNGESE